MVISDEHRYVFIELPHTGSTAIHAELCEHYGGRPVLTKHARYHEFLAQATAEQRRYFAFSCVRHPMDEAVSLYFRYKTNHAGRYTEPGKLRRNGGTVSDHSVRAYRFIRDHDASFVDFFHYYYRRPYDSWSNLAHARLSFVIRFERLQEDFAAVLERLALPQARPLPQVNRTGARRSEFWSYYPEEVRDRARRIFGPFMLEWGFDFPEDWRDTSVPRSSRLAFLAWRAGRKLYWRAWGKRLFG